MSKFREAKSDPKVLVEYLEECEEAYDRGKGKLFVQGKLEEEAAQHAGWIGRYDEMRAELEALKKYYEGKSRAKRGELYRKYLENYARSLQKQDIEQFINADADWQKTDEVLQEISLVHDKMESLVKALQAKGWNIGHVVKLRVQGLEDSLV